MSRYLSFMAEDIPAEYVDVMVKTGLWGETESEVLNCLLLRGIQDAITGRLIPLRDTWSEVAPKEAPEPGTPPPDLGVSRCPECGEPLEPGASCRSLECMPF